MESASKPNTQRLAPIENAPIPTSTHDEVSDDEAPFYLDLVMNHHERTKQNMESRNQEASNNPIPSALVSLPKHPPRGQRTFVEPAN